MLFKFNVNPESSVSPQGSSIFPRARLLHFPVVPSNIMAVELTMFAWKLRVIIFVVITTSLFVSGHKVPRENNCKPSFEKSCESFRLFFQKSDRRKSKLHFEVCAKDKEVIYFCPGDEICWSSGNPESKCFPTDHVLCFPEKKSQFCCHVGYPKSHA